MLDDAPGAELYDPASHGVKVLMPDEGQVAPAGHVAHTDAPVLLYEPAKESWCSYAKKTNDKCVQYDRHIDLYMRTCCIPGIR